MQREVICNLFAFLSRISSGDPITPLAIETHPRIVGVNYICLPNGIKTVVNDFPFANSTSNNIFDITLKCTSLVIC